MDVGLGAWERGDKQASTPYRQVGRLSHASNSGDTFFPLTIRQARGSQKSNVDEPKSLDLNCRDDLNVRRATARHNVDCNLTRSIPYPSQQGRTHPDQVGSIDEHGLGR